MSLSLFTDFMASTGPRYLTSAMDVVNEAVRTNYAGLGYMLKGQMASTVTQGGADIRDSIYLATTRRSRTYAPNEPQTYTMPQTLVGWSIPWRFTMTDMVWTDEEITLQSGGSGASQESKFQKYKDIKYQKERDMWTDALNHMDDLLWAAPDKSKMEAAAGREPYSIPAFINEQTNTLFNSDSTSGAGGAWTTVENIDPTLAGQTTWQNQKFTYANFTVNDSGNLINAFDRAFLSTDFRPPPIKTEFYEGAPTSAQRFIACSLNGYTKTMQLLRASNDRWAALNDPATGFLEVRYAGIPLVYCSQLDTAALYLDTGTSLAAETAANTTGPRFYGINAEYLRSVFHSDRFFHNQGTMRDPAQPTTYIMVVNSYFNLVCRSRRRQFIISPSTDL